MQMNSRIKIIKRYERKLRQDDAHSRERSESELRRDAVATVSDWIDELRRRKRTEAAAASAFKNLSQAA